MVEEFEFPDTGEGVTEGEFLEWDVKEGEEIEEDQIVGKAETDKAVVDIPSPTEGKVEKLKVSAGDQVEVGDVIMEIQSEESNSEKSKVEKDDKTSEEKTESKRDYVDPVFGGEQEKNKKNVSHNSKILALPKVRKLAEEKNIDLASLGEPGERVTEEQVLAAEKDNSSTEKQSSKQQNSASKKDVMATPAVRKLAREKDVTIENIDGSGRNGKILRDDVLEAAKKDVEDANKTSHIISDDKKTEKVEMSSIRQSIASKMSKSRFTAPHVTHVDKADVTELVELRENEKEDVEAHLTYLPFIMKAAYLAMKDYPRLNSELNENEDEVLLKNYYDFNIAVDTERGLMVPKVESVDEKTIVELAEDIGRVVEKTKKGNLTQSDMSGGTFSITNIGVIGGEAFTPIINYPQTAILGIGSIKETAEVYEGELAKRKTVKLSLSFDHRVIDGATAARYVNQIIEYLENPEKMLLELE